MSTLSESIYIDSGDNGLGLAAIGWATEILLCSGTPPALNDPAGNSDSALAGQILARFPVIACAYAPECDLLFQGGWSTVVSEGAITFAALYDGAYITHLIDVATEDQPDTMRLSTLTVAGSGQDLVMFPIFFKLQRVPV